jgi:hypothetical protein
MLRLSRLAAPYVFLRGSLENFTAANNIEFN